MSRMRPKPGCIQVRLSGDSWGAQFSPLDYPADTWEREWFDRTIQQTPEALTDSLAGDCIELTTRGGAVMWVDVREYAYYDAETILVRYSPSPPGIIY